MQRKAERQRARPSREVDVHEMKSSEAGMGAGELGRWTPERCHASCRGRAASEASGRTVLAVGKEGGCLSQHRWKRRPRDRKVRRKLGQMTDQGRDRAEGRADVAFVWTAAGPVSAGGDIVGVRSAVTACGMVVGRMVMDRLLSARVLVTRRQHRRRHFALRPNPGGRAQHGRSNRAPDGKQHSQKQQEPDAKRFHEDLIIA